HRPLRTRLCATDTICPSLLLHSAPLPLFFFFNSTSPTEIYTLSLHDALPISGGVFFQQSLLAHCQLRFILRDNRINQFRQCSPLDRKSTRLNSSHVKISYAVFCLKKKKKKITQNLDNRNNNNRICNKADSMYR